MYRFMAVVWDEFEPRQAEAAAFVTQRIHTTSTNLNIAIESNGLKAFHTNVEATKNRAYLLDGAAGVILGTLFAKQLQHHVSPPEPRLDKGETRAILETAAKHLVENYWGSYIAIIRNPQNGQTHTLRAPAGRIPCLHTTYRGVDIYFSRTEDCARLGIARFTTNWTYVLRNIMWGGLQRLSGTGLNEVSQIHGGECVTRKGGAHKRAIYWDPIEIAQTGIIEDNSVAAAELENTTLACVSAWASLHRNVVLLLSGGLDSSIVLSCLTRSATRPNITCVNYVTPTAEGDERDFARLITRHYGITLVEKMRDHSNTKLDAVLGIERTALPYVYTYHILNGNLESQLAKEYDTSALFSGYLGDAIFHDTAATYAASDFVRMHGIDFRLLAAALATARREGETIWSVLLSAIVSRIKPVPFTLFKNPLEDRIFLTADAVAATSEHNLLPPLVRTTDTLPEGKLRQILACLLTHAYHDPLGRADRPEYLPPLNSQPLLELCFKIPTYLTGAEGKGRATARLAFANHLPSQITNRRTKGAGTDSHRSMLRANHEFLKELLMDGLLVREGIVDRVAVEKHLTNPEMISPVLAVQLPVLYSTEAWLRRWSSVDGQQAVA